uniref:Genome polyprotein n=1 Tax=Cabrillo virus TaxID=3139872 RepID=A0AAN0LXD0_9VIRU
MNRVGALSASVLEPVGGIVESIQQTTEKFGVRQLGPIASDVASSVMGVSDVAAFGGLFGPQNLTHAVQNVTDVFAAHATTFSDQAAVPVQTKVGPSVSAPLLPSNLEVPLEIPTISDRYFQVHTFDWKVKESVGAQYPVLLASLPIPQIMFKTSETTKEKAFQFAPTGVLQYHRFFRTDFEFLIQANAPPFYQGCLLAVYMPVEADQIGFSLDDQKRITVNPGFIVRSPNTLLNYPHGFINLYNNSSVRIQVPFTYFANTYDQIHLGLTSLGVLNIYQWNKLDTYSPSAATIVPVSIAMRFLNMQLSGLRPLFPIPPVADEFQRVDFQGATDVQVLPGVGAQYIGGKFVTTFSPRLSLMDSDSRLDTSSMGYVPTRDFLEFARTPSLVGRALWTTQQNVGTTLLALPVTPSYIPVIIDQNIGDDSVSSQWKKMFSLDTNLSYFSHLYGAWRGGLSYHVQVVMSSFHRGRLQILYIPGDSEVSAIILGDHQNARYKVFDLGVETTFTFTVPYMDSRPYMATEPLFAGGSLVDPSAVISNPSPRPLQYSTGHIQFNVWSKLTAPITVAQRVSLNVYVSAANDFQFFFPATTSFLPGIPTKSPQQQAGEIEAVDVVPDAPQPDVVQKVDDIFMYSHTDVSNFLGRAHHYATLVLSTGKFAGSTRLVAPPATSIGFIFQAHTFWRGEVNLHLSISVPYDCVIYVAVAPPSVQTFNTIDFIMSCGGVVWDTRLNRTLNLRVPWYVEWTALMCDNFYRIDATPRSSGSGLLFSPTSPTFLGTLVAAIAPSSPSVSLEIAMSFPENFDVAVKRAVPCTYTFGPTSTLEVYPGTLDLPTTTVQSHAPVMDLCKYDFQSEVVLQGSVEEVIAEGDIITDGRWYGLAAYEDGLVMYTIVRGDVLRMHGKFRKMNFCDGCATPYDSRAILDHVRALYGEHTSIPFTSQGSRVFASILRNGTGHVHGEVVRQGGVEEVKEPPGTTDPNDNPGFFTRVYNTIASVPESLSSLSFSAAAIRERLVTMESSVFHPDLPSHAIQRAMAFVVKVSTYVTLLVTSENKKKALLSVFSMVAADVMMFAPKACSWIVDRVERFIAKLSSLWPFGKKKEERVEVKTQGLMTDAVEELAVDVGAAMMGTSPSRDLRSWLETCRIVNVVTSAAKGVYWLFSLFITSVRNVFLWFSHRDYSAKMSTLQDAIVQHMASVSALSTLKPEELREHKDEVIKLHATSLTIQIDLADMHVCSNIFTPLRWALAKTDEMYNTVIREDDVYTRVEPAVILISGPPGQGKSILARNLAADLCVIAGLQPTNNIYSKTYGRNADFWDGYTGQYVQIIDDMGQDPEDKDFEGFVQLVSTAVYRCNMAHLNDKGRLYTTPVMIVTTNYGSKFDPTSDVATVRSSAAIARRITMHIRVTCEKDVTPADFVEPTLNKVIMQVDRKVLPYESVLESVDKAVQKKMRTFRDMVSARADYQKAHIKPQLDHAYLDLPKSVSTAPIFAAIKTHVEQQKKTESPLIASLKDLVRKCIDAVKTWWAPIAKLMVTLFSVAGLSYGIYQYFFGAKDEEEPVTEQSVYQPHPAPTRTAKSMPVVKDFVVPQGAEEVLTKISGNVVEVCAEGFSEDRVVRIRMNALALPNDRFVFPFHLVSKFEKPKISITHPLFTTQFEFPDYAKYRVSIGGYPSDMVIADCKMSYHFPDISHFFLSGDDFPRMGMGNVGCILIRKGTTVHALQARSFWHYGSMKLRGELVAAYVMGYTTLTLVGHCGAPVLVKMPEGYRIVGIHVAGDGATRGYCVPITREMVSPRIGLQSLPYVVNVGKLDKRIFMPTATRFRPTVFQHVFTTEVGPSVKSVTDKRCEGSLVDAVFSKYLRPLMPNKVPINHMACVKEYMWSLFSREIGGFHRISYDAAVNGIVPYMKPLNGSSSPGYPYMFDYSCKRAMLESGKTQDAVADLERLYQSGESCEVLFVSYLKDELRPIEKIKSGRTRIIEAAPIQYIVLFRQVVGEFMWGFHARHGIDMHHAVGCDPNVFWTILYHALKERGHGFDVDYSKFDASVSVELLMCVLDVLCQLTDADNAALLRWLWEPIVRSHHVYIDDVYVVEGGVPSGMPCTTIVNTIVNITLVLLVWMQLEDDVYTIDKEVTFVAYGDDLILTTSRDDFTFDLFSQTVATYGFSATNAQKGEGGAWLDVEEMTFLKRGFRSDDLYSFAIHPTLSLQTVESMLCWKSEVAEMQDNVDCACEFLYHHGREIFETFVQIMRYTSTEYGLSLHFYPYTYFEKMWYSALGLDIELQGALEVSVCDHDVQPMTDAGVVGQLNIWEDVWYRLSSPMDRLAGRLPFYWDGDGRFIVDGQGVWLPLSDSQILLVRDYLYLLVIDSGYSVFPFTYDFLVQHWHDPFWRFAELRDVIMHERLLNAHDFVLGEEVPFYLTYSYACTLSDVSTRFMRAVARISVEDYDGVLPDLPEFLEEQSDVVDVVFLQ